MFVFLFGIKLRFKGNAFAGVTASINDEVKSWTDNQIELADFDRDLIRSCYPPSDHFDEGVYEDVIKHVRNGNKDKALRALTDSVLTKVTPYCITVFKKVVAQVATECPKLLSDAMPMSYF